MQETRLSITLHGEESRREGIRLKLEPSPELLQALQEMGEGTKGLRDSVRLASQAEVGVAYQAGYKDGLRDTVLGAGVVLGVLLVVLTKLLTRGR